MLRIWFENGEVRCFDVKPYLQYEVFRPLKNEAMFNAVHTPSGPEHRMA